MSASEQWIHEIRGGRSFGAFACAFAGSGKSAKSVRGIKASHGARLKRRGEQARCAELSRNAFKLLNVMSSPCVITKSEGNLHRCRKKRDPSKIILVWFLKSYANRCRSSSDIAAGELEKSKARL